MTTNEFDQDKEFQALHEKYQAESTELPPAELDVNILQAAHRAVDERPEVVPLKSRKHPWYRPMSYVAILVLSLSVVMRLAFEPDILNSEMVEPEPVASSDYAAEKVQAEADEMAELNAMKEHVQQEPALKARKKQVESLRAKESQIRKSIMEKEQLEKRRMLSKRESLSKMMPRTSAEQGVQSATQSITAEHMAPTRAQSQSALEEATGEALEDKSKKLQSKEIDIMLKLLEAAKFEQLRLALTRYRIKYPFKESSDKLPEALRLLEIKWQTEGE